MYKATIIVSEIKKKGKISRQAVLENEDRNELHKEIAPTIEELAADSEFKTPTADYIIERDGLYLDGEIDVRIKKNRNGVSVKLGDLLI